MPKRIPAYVLLFACLIAGLGLAWFAQSGGSSTALAQISPLSPLAVETAAPAQEESVPAQPPVISPLTPPVTDLPATAIPAQEAPAAPPTQPQLPVGQPQEAQPSLFLVGTILAGLLLTVVLLVMRRRE
jgi:hypothetical protein